MANVYKSLCRELDELLIEIIEESEKQIACKLELEKVMDDGFVNIAKTRYINGSSSVTTLQLPTQLSNPIDPQARVVRSTQQDATEIRVVNTLAPGTVKKITEHQEVRKRTVGDKEPNLKTNPAAAVTTDPIRLFGVLVPQALKTAQKSFVASTDRIAEAAQTQLVLDQKLARYAKLSQIKSRLLTAS